MVHTAVDFSFEKAGGFQDPQMLADRGEGHVERFGEFLNHGLAERQAGQDGAARRIGKSAKGRVQGRR